MIQFSASAGTPTTLVEVTEIHWYSESGVHTYFIDER
jgi:hypothetical protein